MERLVRRSSTSEGGKRYSAIASKFAPTGCFVSRMSTPLRKNIPLLFSPKSPAYPFPSRPTRGAARDRHGRGTGCGGRGRCQKTNDMACGRRSRVVLTPRRWRQVGDDASASRRRWWQTSPVTRESAEETVKTIAQGNAGCPGEPVVTTVCFLPLHTDCGCSGHPAFPAPSLEGRLRPLLRVACALSFGHTFKLASGTSRREKADGCLAWLFDM